MSEPIPLNPRQQRYMSMKLFRVESTGRSCVAHGPTPVIAAVENFDRHVVELFFRARARRFTWHEFQGIVNPLRRLLSDTLKLSAKNSDDRR